MPAKMADRVEALEERLTAMEASMRQSLVEFRQFMLEEFARLHIARSEEWVSSSPEMEASPEERMTVKKVELSLFDGTDPVGWITHAKTYFEVQGLKEEMKVRLAKLSMDGATIHWFNLLHDSGEGLTWTKLKRVYDSIVDFQSL